jgi:hypothetical protein
MGGRLISTTTVCNDCNHSFSTIEGDACRRIAPLGALAGARRGDKKPVTAFIHSDGATHRVEGARMHELAPAPRDRGREYPMPARRDDQVCTIAKALRNLGLPPEAMLDGRFVFEEDEHAHPVPGIQTEPVHISLIWYDRIANRVMTKIAVELLARFDVELAKKPELESARIFARYDKGDARSGIDTETAASGLGQVNAPRIHGMELWTAGYSLHYRMTLFSELRYIGTLTNSWSAGPFKGIYTFDILDPTKMLIISSRSDGATLVNKSRRVRNQELEIASQRFRETSMRLSERRLMRAPKPDLKDLYPDVVQKMENKSKK